MVTGAISGTSGSSGLAPLGGEPEIAQPSNLYKLNSAPSLDRGCMIIVADQVTVSLQAGQQQLTVLHQCSFQTRPHEFVAIVGPSGSGKTTLLRAIAGQLAPSSGAIRFQTDLPGRAAFVSQENNVFPWMTTLRNAAFALEMAGVPLLERESRASAVLARLGLGAHLHAWPHQLSLGMKQRVAVARAFVSDPSLLLMDEPFSGLDAETRSRLQAELLALWETTSVPVLFVTHDIDEAILLSQRILVMSRAPGTIVAEIDVPFAYPRTLGFTLSEEFLTTKRTVYAHLGVTQVLSHAR